jgi:hypothetical protein
VSVVLSEVAGARVAPAVPWTRIYLDFGSRMPVTS